MISDLNKKLIAPCGIYCGQCNDYLACINNDVDLKGKTANEINKQLGINITPQQVGCAGCLGNIHTKWSARLDCQVRNCALKKKIISCAFCGNFPCKKLEKHFHDDDTKQKNLLRIRKIGIESWLKEMQNDIKYEPISKFEKGSISSILLRGFADICDEKLERKILEYDKEAFENLKTVGACLFISILKDKTIGLASWDPRKAPEVAEIGWNTVLPEFKGQGFGKRQILEILCRFKAAKIKRAFVRTGQHPFFIPAQKTYLS